MFRLKLALVLLFLLATVAGVGSFLARSASSGLLVDLEERVRSGAQSVNLGNAVDGNSLYIAAGSAAATQALIDAIRCPATADGLRDANREQTPAVDPTTGTPILDALGRPLDTTGRPIEPGAPRCTAVQHDAVLAALGGWNAAQAAARNDAAALDAFARAPGFSIPRTPDLLIVANAAGEVIGRVGGDYDDWFGPTRPNMNTFPVVALAELGQPQHGTIVWREYESAQPSLTQIGVAPLMANGEFLGTVTVGFHVVNESADEDRSLNYGIDVAYFFRESADAAPTFSGNSFGSRPDFLQALAQGEFFLQKSDGSTDATAVSLTALATGGLNKVYRFGRGDRAYLVAPAALSTDAATGAALTGFVVVASASDLTGPIDQIASVLPVVALIALIVGAFILALLMKSYMQPLEDIARGIQEVIAGNKDYMWPVDEKSEFSDLCHSLNIMSASLQGKRAPDAEDNEGGEGWGGLVGGAPAPKPGGPAAVAGIGALRGRRSADGESSAPGDGDSGAPKA